MHKPVDFAIVGGGVAGSYVAWRLACSDPDNKLTIQLYEGTRRIGGRLCSASMPLIKDKTAELGGMRYAAPHILVSALVSALGLPTERFDYKQRAMRLRGKYFAVPEKDPFPNEGAQAPPYTFNGEESGKQPGELIRFALREALRDKDFCFVWPAGTPEQCRAVEKKWQEWKAANRDLTYAEFKPWEWDCIGRYAVLKGSSLWDLGFWNVLQHYLEIESFLFAHDGLGYESVVANWNAAEAIPWFLKDFDLVEYHTVISGMQAIPMKLAAQFLAKRQNCVRWQYILQSVEKSSSSSALKLIFWNDFLGEYVTAFAMRVVLAMPKHALQNIRFRGFSDDSEAFAGPDGDTIGNLEAVTCHPMAKLFLGYEDAWWTSEGLFGTSKGKLTTDSPLRQVYFLGPDRSLPKDVKTPSLIMASYSDSHYVDFWRPLYPRGKNWAPYYQGPPEEMTPELRLFLEAFGVGENVIRKATRLMKKLFSDQTVPDPYMGFLVTWDGPPYYGGWHTWNVHEKPWVLRGKMKRPFPKDNLFICGEAYSREQGWVEGALRSAEMVLRELKIKEPDFVDQKLYTDEGFSGYDDYVS